MEERVNVLIYAVRGRVILKYAGQLALILGVLTLVPLGVALLTTDWLLLSRYAVICGGLFLAGGLLSRLPAPTHMQANEALTITALAFVFSPISSNTCFRAITVGVPTSLLRNIFLAISPFINLSLLYVANP